LMMDMQYSSFGVKKSLGVHYTLRADRSEID
jgi:hypothetical protein